MTYWGNHLIAIIFLTFKWDPECSSQYFTAMERSFAHRAHRTQRWPRNRSLDYGDPSNTVSRTDEANAFLVHWFYFIASLLTFAGSIQLRHRPTPHAGKIQCTWWMHHISTERLSCIPGFCHGNWHQFHLISHLFSTIWCRLSDSDVTHAEPYKLTVIIYPVIHFISSSCMHLGNCQN